MKNDEGPKFMFFTYIVECADKSLYVGCTNNLEKRITQHNDSKWGAHYTKIRRPVVLKYSEEFSTLIEARKRESEINDQNNDRTFKLTESHLYPLTYFSDPKK